jgi:release factor glutamine methyltransferase
MTNPLRIDAALADAARRLRPVSDSPRLDAELLLARAIDTTRSYLFAHPEDTLDALAAERFEESLARRIDGEPMAYVTGTREFWSLEFMVTPATLVPRPETEILVDLALGEIPCRAEIRVLDLGTGCGAIALAIASERAWCAVTATDVSAGALAVAEQNARQLGLPNVEFLCGDWGEPVTGRVFDVIVSNPPYVENEDPALAALRREPPSALLAGSDGLDAIRQLAAECGALLADDGVMLIEHGAGQQDPVADVLKRHSWTDIVCHKDLAGQPRVTVARRA